MRRNTRGYGYGYGAPLHQARRGGPRRAVGGLAGRRPAGRGAGRIGVRPALAGLRGSATEITGTVSHERDADAASGDPRSDTGGQGPDPESPGADSRDLSGVAPPRAKPSENVTLPIEPDRPTTDCFRPKAISRREENGATKYTELNDEIDEIGF